TTPHRAGHGRTRRQRRRGRPPRRPHQHPGTPTEHTRPATTTRTRNDPADRPRDTTATRRRRQPPEPTRPRHTLAHLATPPPSPLTLVPPTHPTQPRLRPHHLPPA